MSSLDIMFNDSQFISNDRSINQLADAKIVPCQHTINKPIMYIKKLNNNMDINSHLVQY